MNGEENEYKPGFIGKIFRAIGLSLSKTVMFVVERVAGILIVILVVYGAPYYFLTHNPEIKDKIIAKIKNIDSFFTNGKGGSSTGFDVKSLMAMFGGGGREVTKERVIERTIVQQKIEYIPPQLIPFMNALEKVGKEAGSVEVERYRAMLTSDRTGRNGEKSVGILSNALKSSNKIIRRGAFNSLKLVGTTEAKKALTDYINNARRRR